jgi:hypothetical protein
LSKASHLIARRSLLGAIVAVATGAVVTGRTMSAFAAEADITVHKDSNCGCCSGWVEHLRAAGFSVDARDTADVARVKQQHGVPPELASCHTAIVGGYVIEGHVPALAIRRLLAERPDASGLAVPGMPVGSPGMEGGTPQAYAVVLFGPAKQTPYMRFLGAQPLGG